jgi:hypothetical protein
MFAFLAGLFAQLFATSAAWFVALKLLLVTLIMVVLPILLTNFFASIVSGILTLAGEQFTGASSVVAELTGVAAYIATQLELPAAFAVIFSAFAAKFALKLIPFVRI